MGCDLFLMMLSWSAKVNYAQTQAQPEPIAVGARSYRGGLYQSRSAPAPTGDRTVIFVGGRWPRPPSLAMSPQFTLAEADELRARPLFVSITVGAQI